MKINKSNGGQKIYCTNCNKITTMSEHITDGGYYDKTVCDACGAKQDLAYDRCAYSEKCVGCGKEHTLLTQHDNNPEYYSNVSVICSCGLVVDFSLPVN